MKKFRKYQEQTEKTHKYRTKQSTDTLGLGLAGEVGEVCNELKKITRDDEGVITQKRRLRLTDELGDVLWYYVRLIDTLDIDIEEIMKFNVAKLKERHGKKPPQ